MADEPVNDYELIVTVRLHGEGGADEAAKVMESYTGTFVLDNGSEAEIVKVVPLPEAGFAGVIPAREADGGG
jgi:hypothetical protein